MEQQLSQEKIIAALESELHETHSRLVQWRAMAMHLSAMLEENTDSNAETPSEG